MIDIPQAIRNSTLWRLLDPHAGLRAALVELRRVAAALGAEVARLIPSYTDHSVTHMDALWSIADQVFTLHELGLFSPGEAFILGSSFYVHDLGMALAATEEGMRDLMTSDVFTTSLARAIQVHGIEQEKAKTIALQIAARDAHAKKARELVGAPLPGIGRYLIESTDLREKWAAYIGDVSASHHWSLPAVENRLGIRGKVPDPIGGEIDLGFLACALRIIDYAHINSDRASYLTRVLRSAVDTGSLIHWKAQEHITGPRRQEDRLVFGCTRPLENVEAWWLFFEMATGLDSEINAVAEYLAGRATSVGRFSLEGVKGVRSPQTFASFIVPEEFEPVDVRFRPDSIERLVGILGGRTLYGDDAFAAVRELLQNARDAILLQRAVDSISGHASQDGRIDVALESDGRGEALVVNDNGVGMTADVITNYLLGIASDYWNSSHFFANYPGVAEAGFQPAGRFGIGFLSVFMLGEEVEVQTQRQGGAHLTLTLSGVGKRGALVTNPPRADSGTTVRVRLTKQNPSNYRDLDAIVRARAPMLHFPVHVALPTRRSVIVPKWWRTVSQEELYDFVLEWPRTAHIPADVDENKPKDHFRHMLYLRRMRQERFHELSRFSKWPERQPEISSDSYRILAIPGRNFVLLCSRGIAVTTIPVSGIVGIVQTDDLVLNAARSAALEWDSKRFREDLIAQLHPKIIQALDELEMEGTVPSRFEFVCHVAQEYGEDLLLRTGLPWITVMEPPGNAILVSAAEFTRRVASALEVLVSFGVGPWSVEKVCREHFSGASPTALLIPVTSVGQPSFGSYTDERIVLAPLPEHFRRDREEYERAALLLATLKAIAAGWDCDVAQFIEANWSREKTSSLCLHLKR